MYVLCMRIFNSLPTYRDCGKKIKKMSKRQWLGGEFEPQFYTQWPAKDRYTAYMNKKARNYGYGLAQSFDHVSPYMPPGIYATSENYTGIQEIFSFIPGSKVPSPNYLMDRSRKELSTHGSYMRSKI